MATKDVAGDLCALLEGQTLAGVLLSAGQNLYSSGRQEPGSRPAVYLLNAGGGAPQFILGGNREAVFSPSVQVMVEGVEDDWSTAESLARAVYDTLQMAEVSGYLGVFCRDSAPAYVSANLWVINVDALWGP